MQEIKTQVTHCGTARLETPRLLLRRATMDDCSAIHERLNTDPAIIDYVGWDECDTMEDTRKRLAELLEQYNDPGVYYWLIIEKASNVLAGIIYVNTLIENRRTVEIDYGIVQAFRGKGYAPEALRCVAEYLFFEAGFYRVETQCNLDNPSSERVMRKAGMQREGILRGRAMRLKEDGNPDDLLIYGITASDMLCSE